MLQSTFSLAQDTAKVVVTMITVMSNPTTPTLVEESKGGAAVQQNSLLQIAMCFKECQSKKIKSEIMWDQIKPHAMSYV